MTADWQSEEATRSMATTDAASRVNPNAVNVFAALHAKTCGVEAVEVEGMRDALRQRCRCGAEQIVPLSFDEVEAKRETANAEPLFDEALLRASRRVVQ